jgi:hypothetical protein
MSEECLSGIHFEIDFPAVALVRVDEIAKVIHLTPPSEAS